MIIQINTEVPTTLKDKNINIMPFTNHIHSNTEKSAFVLKAKIKKIIALRVSLTTFTP